MLTKYSGRVTRRDTEFKVYGGNTDYIAYLTKTAYGSGPTPIKDWFEESFVKTTDRGTREAKLGHLCGFIAQFDGSDGSYEKAIKTTLLFAPFAALRYYRMPCGTTLASVVFLPSSKLDMMTRNIEDNKARFLDRKPLRVASMIQAFDRVRPTMKAPATQRKRVSRIQIPWGGL